MAGADGRWEGGDVQIRAAAGLTEITIISPISANGCFPGTGWPAGTETRTEKVIRCVRTAP